VEALESEEVCDVTTERTVIKLTGSSRLRSIPQPELAGFRAGCWLDGTANVEAILLESAFCKLVCCIFPVELNTLEVSEAPVVVTVRDEGQIKVQPFPGIGIEPSADALRDEVLQREVVSPSVRVDPSRGIDEGQGRPSMNSIWFRIASWISSSGSVGQFVASSEGIVKGVVLEQVFRYSPRRDDVSESIDADASASLGHMPKRFP
jgi:hypothetical protein